jgi:ribosome biogenesis GTPase
MTKRGLRRAIVITRFNKNLTIEDEDGVLIPAVARQRLTTPVCGDRIHWRSAAGSQAVIEDIDERSSLLARPDKRGRLRPMAANITQMMIVSAIDINEPLTFNDSLIDHYLVTAETVHIHPVIVINKIDLINDEQLDRVREHFDQYLALDYPVIYTSNLDQRGQGQLMERLLQQTSIFVGESGAGKSSLINTLLPEQALRTGDLSAVSGKGMHTTSATTLYHLPHGGDLIDSPGVREFGLTLDECQAIAAGFREFSPYLGQCKFRNCRHLGEQGCAVEQACHDGDIQSRRLSSYRNMVATFARKQ